MPPLFLPALVSISIHKTAFISHTQQATAISISRQQVGGATDLIFYRAKQNGSIAVPANLLLTHS